METLKTHINKNFNTLSVVTSAVIFSIILLTIRIKINNSFFLLFLVWNIVLAIIPYVITMYLNSVKMTKLKLVFWFIIWLLFLPNAPYIITDLLHLRVSNANLLWLDILVILSFAFSGLLLFYLSLLDMKALIQKQFKKPPIKLVIISVIFLSAFGVYLGRFLRYNSWEIISQPQDLFSDIFEMILYPKLHFEAWLFTFGFGGFLIIGYWVFQNLHEIK